MSGHMNKSQVPLVQERLGYVFSSFDLLEAACMYVPVKHGYGDADKAKMRKGRDITKRGWELESIGDAILLIVVRRKICPLAGLTHTSKIVAQIVCNKNLRECGVKLGLPDVNSAADRVEAIIGAVWLDTDEHFKKTQVVVERILGYGSFDYLNYRCD